MKQRGRMERERERECACIRKSREMETVMRKNKKY